MAKEKAIYSLLGAVLASYILASVAFAMSTEGRLSSLESFQQLYDERHDETQKKLDYIIENIHKGKDQ